MTREGDSTGEVPRRVPQRLVLRMRLAIIILPALFAAAPAASERPRQNSVPPLVVVISIDQFGSGLLDQNRDRFKAGLARVLHQGMVYSNAYQAHGLTETCPGHSTLLTGVHPWRTGLVANGWYSAEADREIYCLESTSRKLAHDPGAEGRGPEQLMTTTLGDWMKTSASGGQVIAVSGKDRGALAMGGHLADAWYWYDDGFQGFTTTVSSGEDAAEKLRPVAAFNTALRDELKDGVPRWTYSDPNCRKLERHLQLGEKLWHATLPPTGWSTEVAAPSRALRTTPFLDIATLDLASKLIDHHQLGMDENPDLLTISLSATDAIGHAYGTRGPEMCDQLARLDEALGGFLAYVLDVAPAALVVITADHGGSDITERLQLDGYPEASRVPPISFLEQLNTSVATALKLDFMPFVVVPPGHKIDQLYLSHAAVEALSPERKSRAISLALAWLRGRPEVVEAHEQQALLAARREHDFSGSTAGRTGPEGASLEHRMMQSAYPGRSATIMVSYRPLTATLPPREGFHLSTHGSAWDYDRRVPLIFYSRAISADVRPFAVGTVDLAPTLAAIMDVPVPNGLDGRCLPILPAKKCPETAVGGLGMNQEGSARGPRSKPETGRE